MPFQVLREDITQIKVDAIVNPTDRFFSGGGSIDKKIHDAAGINLRNACNKFDELSVGDAVITSAYNMSNTKYVIHTVGPVYKDGKHNEAKYLRTCYKKALQLAIENNISSIAMPLISTGTFRYPKKAAMKIATDVITDFVYNNEIDVYLLVYDNESYDISNKLFKDVGDYLKSKGFFDDDLDATEFFRCQNRRDDYILEKECRCLDAIEYDRVPDFDDYVPEESFNDCLRRHIIEKDLLELEVYKGANLSKQAFNKIYNEGSIPKKENVVGLAYSMKLDMDETIDFVEKAGYSFGRTKFDALVTYYIEHNLFDIDKLNKHLSRLNLAHIGSRDYSLEK